VIASSGRKQSLSRICADSCVPWEDIEVLSLAVAYVPMQRLCNTFEPTAALIHGTVFPQLTGIYNHNYSGVSE
jgi:hypothetical protein